MPASAGRHGVLLTTAFVFHVVSGALWTGATLYVVYATVPRATDGTLGREAFVDAAHRLLVVTRWTGVVLPLTGAYMVWRCQRAPASPSFCSPTPRSCRAGCPCDHAPAET